MFTGIIEEMGSALEAIPMGDSRRISIKAELVTNDTKLGESIAVNGVCVTVTRLRGNIFTADLSPETIRRSNLGTLKPGDNVNLERALRIGDRLGGHVVTGHVDGTGRVVSRRDDGNSIVITVRAPQEIMRYVVPKGSIAVDGVSLTIADCREDCFTVAIIPHTAISTTLGIKKAGDIVNLECDILGKYVERLLNFKGEPPQDSNQAERSALTVEFLKSMGF